MQECEKMDPNDIDEFRRRAEILVGEDPPPLEFEFSDDSKLIFVDSEDKFAVRTLSEALELADENDTIIIKPRKGGDTMPRYPNTSTYYNPPKYTTVFGRPISSKSIQHTNMRFNSMTEKQLWTRMGKITNEEKLLAFAYVADQRGVDDLSMAALARFVRLTGDNSVMEAKFGRAKKEPKKDEKTDRLLRRMDV